MAGSFFSCELPTTKSLDFIGVSSLLHSSHLFVCRASLTPPLPVFLSFSLSLSLPLSPSRQYSDVGLTFLFAFVLLILASLAFFFGSNMQKICQAIEPPEYELYTRVRLSSIYTISRRCLRKTFLRVSQFESSKIFCLPLCRNLFSRLKGYHGSVLGGVLNTPNVHCFM